MPRRRRCVTARRSCCRARSPACTRCRAAHLTQPRPAVEGGLADQLLQVLPYELTEGQQKVGAEIAADLSSESPMNRLLQGDVGSGKTVVALRAMLQVADAGGQSAMLAPTEVLAEQHLRSVLDILGGYGGARRL